MQDMQKLFRAFRGSGEELYLVGGCVRDHLLGVESNDHDFATSARPEKTISILCNEGLKSIPIGIEFGTIQTELDGEVVEITTYRCKESYKKGSRKPSVVFGDRLEDDLVRRDFTFNAMAMDSDGTIIDPFDGQSDLENGIIRTPSDPTIAFTDDPLRMLRAARFVARGLGKLCANTHRSMYTHNNLVNDLSAERVFSEMTKLLVSDNPVAGLRVLEETTVLETLFPELKRLLYFEGDTGKWHHLSIWEHTLATVGYTPAIAEVRWAALFHDSGKPACYTKKGKDVHYYDHHKVGEKIWNEVAIRLKTSNEFRRHVCSLIYEHQNLRNDMGVRGIRRLIHRLGDRLDNLFLHTTADIKAHVPRIVEPKLRELNELRSRVDDVINGPAPVTNRLPKGLGNLVCEATGIEPGPELGRIIKRMQQMMIDGDLNNESDFVAVAQKIHEANG